jgi:RHS repeat-associated protein
LHFIASISYTNTAQTLRLDTLKTGPTNNLQNFSYTYDNVGNVKTINDLLRGQTTTTYAYDGDGNRVKRVANGVTSYYIGNHYEVTVSVATSVLKYYYFGKQRIALRNSVGVVYLHSDHLGSTSVTSGATSSAQTYYPFGSIRTATGSVPTDFGFTGQRRDASAGLMYYGARYYDSALGRFIQADTWVPSPNIPQNLNRYTYTLNNPLRYADPDGHCVPACAILYALFEFFANPNSAGGDLYDKSGMLCVDGCVSDSPTNPELALQVAVDVTAAEVGGKVAGKAIGAAKAPARKVLGTAGEVIQTTSIGLVYRAGMRRFIGIGEEAVAPIVERFGVTAASKVPMQAGDLPSQFANRRIWALGSQSATEAAAKAGSFGSTS